MITLVYNIIRLLIKLVDLNFLKQCFKSLFTALELTRFFLCDKLLTYIIQFMKYFQKSKRPTYVILAKLMLPAMLPIF